MAKLPVPDTKIEPDVVPGKRELGPTEACPEPEAEPSGPREVPVRPLFRLSPFWALCRVRGVPEPNTTSARDRVAVGWVRTTGVVDDRILGAGDGQRRRSRVGWSLGGRGFQGTLERAED